MVGEMAVAMAAIKNPQTLQQKVADWVKGFVKMAEPSD